MLPGAVYPPDLAPRAQSLLVPVETVGYAQVRRFLNVAQSEFDAEPVKVFRNVLAKTWTDHRVAINLSGQSLGEESFHEFVTDCFMHYGVVPSMICAG